MNARTCLGCDGGGRVLPVAGMPDRYGRVIDHVVARTVGCLACQGSGQVTDRITVQDALADAETLRPLLTERKLMAKGFKDVLIAQEQGLPWFAWRGAMWATNSAFCAVPGLRG